MTYRVISRLNKNGAEFVTYFKDRLDAVVHASLLAESGTRNGIRVFDESGNEYMF